jgi:hypothetical protein
VCKHRFGIKASKSSADTEHSKSQAEAPDVKTIKTRDKFLTKTFLSTSWTRWENLALRIEEMIDCSGFKLFSDEQSESFGVRCVSTALGLRHLKALLTQSTPKVRPRRLT